MCEPTTIAAVASGGGQILAHQAENNAIAGRNRAKLREFQLKNEQYKRDVMFDNAQYRNDIAVTDIAQDDVYKAMVGQWTEADKELDKLFAESDFKLEEAVIEMYENEYAGTGTGATAARLAGKSAKKAGQKKSKILHDLMSGQEDTIIAKEKATSKAKSDSWQLHEKIAFAPIHGTTPMSPELEPRKSSAGLILGLAGTIAEAKA